MCFSGWREAEIEWTYVSYYTPYKWHFACFDCRVGLKYIGEARADPYHYVGKRCGRCGKDATPVGKDCRVPKRKDIKGWKKLKGLIDSGIRFDPREDQYCSVKRVRHEERDLIALWRKTPLEPPVTASKNEPPSLGAQE